MVNKTSMVLVKNTSQRVVSLSRLDASRLLLLPVVIPRLPLVSSLLLLHLLLEFLHDVAASLLASRYIDSLRCTSGDRNHILECGMIKGANRLENKSNMRKWVS